MCVHAGDRKENPPGATGFLDKIVQLTGKLLRITARRVKGKDTTAAIDGAAHDTRITILGWNRVGMPCDTSDVPAGDIRANRRPGFGCRPPRRPRREIKRSGKGLV